MKENWKLYIPVLISLVLIISAFFHIQLIANIENYRQSYLINIEFISLIISFITVLISSAFSIVFIIKKQYGKLFHSLAGIILTLIIISIAMSVDSPTLLYMT